MCERQYPPKTEEMEVGVRQSVQFLHMENE